MPNGDPQRMSSACPSMRTPCQSSSYVRLRADYLHLPINGCNSQRSTKAKGS